MVTKRDLEVAIAAYGLGRILPAGTTRAAVRATIPKLVKAGRVVGPPAARGIASAAAANPITAGTALGLGALATPPGQALLESAAERGAADRVRAQQLFDEFVFRNFTRPAEMAGDIVTSPTFVGQVKTKAKKKVSKYSKAVKAGMKAVKSSKFGGKKGTIKTPKATFATVSKVVSAVNKGKKVTTKGIRGTIARAARRILK